MSEPACWCSSECKCPHHFSAKLPGLWEDLEKTIDDVLHQFDRKAVKAFLKRDSDGNAKQLSSPQLFQETYAKTGAAEEQKEPKKKLKGGAGPQRSPSRQGTIALINSTMLEEGHYTNPLAMSPFPSDFERSSGSNVVRPKSGNKSVRPKSGSGVKGNGTNSLPRVPGSSEGHRPNTTAPMTPSSAYVSKIKSISKNSSSKQMPLEDRMLSTEEFGTTAKPVEVNLFKSVSTPGVQQATPGSAKSNRHMQQEKIVQRAWEQSLPHQSDGKMPRAITPGKTTSVPGPDYAYTPIELPSNTAIATGLLRIADHVSRKVLPWQAVTCPRAVESLRETRLSIVQAKHDNFMLKMTRQLEDKVFGFLQKKEEEVENWMQREVDLWQKNLHDEEDIQSEFILWDQQRLTARSNKQHTAAIDRNLLLTGSVDDAERDVTREDIVSFRRLCRNEKKSDIRAVTVSIQNAQTAADASNSVSQRDLFRRHDDSYDWLCCVADNAITAQESEALLKTMYVTLDAEKKRALDSLNSSLKSYHEQHNLIIDAIITFHGRVHTHAKDYLCREQLVAKAFLQYLMSIISGEVSPHTSDHRKNSVAWEGKFISDRAYKRDHQMNREFNECLVPFDNIVTQLRERMSGQVELVVTKMNSVLNGRDNDINRRKSLIHKRLAKHVKSVCNQRRNRLTDEENFREKEFALEGGCMKAITEFTSELRSMMDQTWVTETIKERRINEATLGRMDGLEKISLVIWEKHAHDAMTTHEDYEKWLDKFQKARDQDVYESRLQVNQNWRLFRKSFCRSLRDVGKSLHTPIHNLVHSVMEFDVSNTAEANAAVLKRRKTQACLLLNETLDAILPEILHKYESCENDASAKMYSARKAALKVDWQTNLNRLNGAINQRIGSLKGMEADLENSIRLLIAQNEIESNVFEQGSCSRLELFWVSWRDKLDNMGKKLIETLVDFRMNHSIKGNSATMKDKELRRVGDGGVSAPVLENATQLMPASNTEPVAGAAVLSDTCRLKTILDEIKHDAYLDFQRRCSRGVEGLRKKFGEGRTRTIPPWMVVKVILGAADAFYERGKLSERCAGRVASKGMRLFMTGLPRHSRSLFCLGVALTVVTSVPLHGHRMDSDQVMGFIQQGVKRLFLCGLLTITNQLGSYGEYMLHAEATWVCSSCMVSPPRAPTETTVNFKKRPLIPDPVDTVNSLLSLSDSPTEQELQRAYALGGLLPPAPVQEENEARHTHKYTSSYQKEKEEFIDTELGEPEATEHDRPDVLDISEQITQADFVQRVSNVLPVSDSTALLGLLGRHGNIVEITYNRMGQAVYFWRKVALAIVTASLDPPSQDYVAMSDLLTTHLTNIEANGKFGRSNMISLSPFEAVTHTVDWITSIVGVPISVLQGLSLVTRSGSCDPWLEDLKQSNRTSRFPYEVTELLDTYSCNDYDEFDNDTSNGTNFQASIFGEVEQILRSLDVNGSGYVPLELLRTYIEKEDIELTNAQITAVYWCLCRSTGDAEVYRGIDPRAEKAHPTLNLDNLFNPAVGSSVKDGAPDAGLFNKINPEFDGNVDTYVMDFASQIETAVDTVPFLDTSVIIGQLPTPLTGEDGHKLVTQAMKLNAAAMNVPPNSCCIWIGQRTARVEAALASVTISSARDSETSTGSLDKYIGPGEIFVMDDNSPYRQTINNNPVKYKLHMLKIRLKLEIDMLTKYPVICERMASDTCYGPGGGDTIMVDDHFKELIKRRLDRLDKLSVAWRGTMMNEWASSLYEARKLRYLKRADAVRECIRLYQQQYNELKQSMKEERLEVLLHYPRLLDEYSAMQQEDSVTLFYHTKFLSESVGFFREKIHVYVDLIYDLLVHVQRHCSVIKRKAIARVKKAYCTMKIQLATSCAGLITGYTDGFAKHHFDELRFRWDRWQVNFSIFHGTVIVSKENFANNKVAMDNEVLNQISDRITIDRNRTKKLLDRLAKETNVFRALVNVAKDDYEHLQNDANQRVMMRIDRAVRECRKLRDAAEEDQYLEEHVFKEVTTILNETVASCNSIVLQVKKLCDDQLATVEPRGVLHQSKQKVLVAEASDGWKSLEQLLVPLSDNYEKAVRQQMSALKSRSLITVNVYQEEEIALIQEEYVKERALLIQSFRTHFKEYDLLEAEIFERFNTEVTGTGDDIRNTWGENVPTFMKTAFRDMRQLNKLLPSTLLKRVVAEREDNACGLDDDVILARMEVVDTLGYNMRTLVDVVDEVPKIYLTEKKNQLKMVKDMGLTNADDMVAPQVTAVMDLLLSGIEIDREFADGYVNLKHATRTKADEITQEVHEFMERYLDPNEPVAITHTSVTCVDRIQQRRDEVNTMIAASEAHLAAEHSNIACDIKTGYGDIKEWEVNTMQLISKAYDTAKDTYLKSKWLTPPPSPGNLVEDMPIVEEDRVKKVKALAASANVYPNEKEEMFTGGYIEDAIGGDVPVESNPDRITDPTKTRELQEGWLECCTEEQVTYYFNKETGESLWDLPENLKLARFVEPANAGSGFLDTPRALVVGDAAVREPTPPATPDKYGSPDKYGVVDISSIPMLMSPPRSKQKKDYRGTIDVTMVMSNVMSESTRLAAEVLNVALEITSVIRGQPIEHSSDSSLTTTVVPVTEPVYVAPAPKVNRVLLSDKDFVVHEDRIIDESVTSLTQGRDDSVMGELRRAAFAEEESVVVRQRQAMVDHRTEIEANLLGALDDEDSVLLYGGSEGISGIEAWLLQSFPADSAEEEVEGTVTLKEKLFQLIRNNDLMRQEDELAYAQRDAYQEQLKIEVGKALAVFMGLPQEELTMQKYEELKSFGLRLRDEYLASVLKAAKTSWSQQLDRVNKQLTVLQVAKEGAAEVRKKILAEFEEDMAELVDFFKNVVGLSKVVSKKTAQDSIALHITTAKKLSKMWYKGSVNIMDDLHLDSVDAEEVEMALRQIGEQQERQKGMVSFYEESYHNSHTNSQTFDIFGSEFGITEVTEAGDYVDHGNDQLLSYGAIDEVPVSPMNAKDLEAYGFATPRSPISPKQPVSLSKWNAYKSFHGGWVEGYSDNQEIYYYNIHTGQSRWKLPEGAHAIEAPMAEDGSPTKALPPPEAGGVEGYTNESYHYDASYTDPHAYDESGYYDTNNVYHENSAYDHNTQYHDGTYSHDANAPYSYDGTYEAFSNYDQNAYYDPNGHYDANGNYISGTHYDASTDYPYTQVDQTGQFGEYQQAPGAPSDPYFDQALALYSLPEPKGVHFRRPRMLPIPICMEVKSFSKEEGVKRQVALLGQQDSWQQAQTEAVNSIDDCQKMYKKDKDDLFHKVSLRVETRLGVFVDDIKYLQRTLKKELQDLEASERDLRRLFDEPELSVHVILAEKLSFILEGIEKIKSNASDRYEGAAKQMDKFAFDWKNIVSELTQVGAIFDDTVIANLEQCKLSMEHFVKVFAFEQLKNSSSMKRREMKSFRRSLSKCLQSDTLLAQQSRVIPYEEQMVRYRALEETLLYERWSTMQGELTEAAQAGFSDTASALLDKYKREHARPVIVKLPDEVYIRPEEELVMSFMLTQVEMEVSLSADYDSVTDATKKMARELSDKCEKFDNAEKMLSVEEGSWFNKHRESLIRHSNALNVTLQRLKTSINDGYKLLNSKVEALDYDVEQSAEAEVAQMGDNDDVVEEEEEIYTEVQPDYM